MKKLGLTLCLLINQISYSQNSSTGNWIMLFSNEKLGNRTNLHIEHQYRDNDIIGNKQQSLTRAGIGYNLTENSNILLGYGFIRTFYSTDEIDDKLHIDEHRIFQQLITKQSLGRAILSHRYRIEERFIENNTNLRFRYQLSAQIPLNSKKMSKSTLYGNLYNEIFINANKEAFDRNRAYIALGYVINDHIRIEGGFMNQSQKEQSKNQFQIGIYLQNISKILSQRSS